MVQYIIIVRTSSHRYRFSNMWFDSHTIVIFCLSICWASMPSSPYKNYTHENTTLDKPKKKHACSKFLISNVEPQVFGRNTQNSHAVPQEPVLLHKHPTFFTIISIRERERAMSLFRNVKDVLHGQRIVCQCNNGDKTVWMEHISSNEIIPTLMSLHLHVTPGIAHLAEYFIFTHGRTMPLRDIFLSRSKRQDAYIHATFRRVVDLKTSHRLTLITAHSKTPSLSTPSLPSTSTFCVYANTILPLNFVFTATQ